MIGWIILGAVVLFLAVLIIRALCFQPKAQRPIDESAVAFEQDAAVSALQKLVQCKTISYNDPALEDEAEFRKLIDLLPGLYPKVFETCSFQQLPDRALLFHWNGKNHTAPAVLMAHYDVVPVREEMWDKPPFAGMIEDGVLWGRGTLDTKVTMNGALFAANTLMEQGFVPENDIYFAFSGGEEVNGKGAKNIVDWFVENHIAPVSAVCHQVVALIMQDQLIGRYPLERRFMQLLIKTIFIIIILQLFSFLYGNVHHLNIIKQRRIFRLVPFLDGVDVLHMAAEIFIRKLAEFFNQVRRLPGIDMLTTQNAVYQ